MKSSLIYLVISTVFLAHFSLQEVPPSVFKVSISKADASKAEGVNVYGAKQCGGPGEFLQFRIEGCNPTAPCTLKGEGETLHADVDFRPVIDMAQLKYKVTIVENGNSIVLHDAAIPNSAVEKGSKYTIHVDAAAATGIKGKIQGKHEIKNAADDSLRVCMEAEIEWI